MQKKQTNFLSLDFWRLFYDNEFIMIDTSQILIVAAITVMTVILTIIGVQLIFVLRDLRILLDKINNIVSEVEKIGLNIGQGYSEVMGFVAGVKNLFLLTDYIAQKKKKKNDKK